MRVHFQVYRISQYNTQKGTYYFEIKGIRIPLGFYINDKSIENILDKFMYNELLDDLYVSYDDINYRELKISSKEEYLNFKDKYPELFI